MSHSFALSYSKLHLGSPVLKLVLINIGEHKFVFSVSVSVLFRVPWDRCLESLTLHSQLEEPFEERIELWIPADLCKG